MTAEPDPPARFAALPLREELLTALGRLGYEEPTPIQVQAIPPLLEGRDLLGQAATGTGKTAAFALPLLQRLSPLPRGPHPQALVLVPTRELAMQVSQAIHTYGRGLDARVLPIYGGQPIWRQLKELRRGVDVVVATPGRAVDHLGRGTLHLDEVEMVVLDEADEMLDLGFADDLDTILAAAPEQRQTMLFSATLPPRITGLAARGLKDPVRVTIGRGGAGSAAPSLVDQRAYVVGRQHKPAALGRILDVEAPAAALVFCGTRVEVDQLTEVMNGRGYRAEALHGGMSQEQRDRVMDRLRSETADLLVATDVAARGLDIDHLSHVINHDVPTDADAYVHRVGRVGRAGRSGVAITLVEPRQTRLLRSIEQHTRQRIEVVPIPTVADLRARRLELTTEAVRGQLESDTDLDRFRGVLEALADEYDLLEVALGAVALAHEAVAGSDEDDTDLPDLRLRDEPGAGRGRGTGSGKGRGRPQRRSASPPTLGTVRLFVGLGRNQGIRPADLVGAIANESELSGKQIGAIEITPNFSLVEVPETAADAVVKALRQTTLKGRRATVRPDRNA